MAASDLKLSEITDLNDDLLLPWLELYETAFPPEERILVADLLGVIKVKGQGGDANTHVAAVTSDGQFASLMMWSLFPDAEFGALWYFAVSDKLRNAGIGSAIYNEILSIMKAAGVRAMIFEVEVPEEQKSEKLRTLAQRRIGFYHRLGARQLRGIHYMQYVGPHQPPIPCHIMVHTFEDLTPQEVFDMAKCAFEENVNQVAILELG